MDEFIKECPLCGVQSRVCNSSREKNLQKEFGKQLSFKNFCICRNRKNARRRMLAQEMMANQKSDHEGILFFHSELKSWPERVALVSSRESKTRESLFNELPIHVESVLRAAMTCMSTNCLNSAVTMFRLCVDRATSAVLSQEGAGGAVEEAEKCLRLRLKWLFDRGKLPESLRDMSIGLLEGGTRSTRLVSSDRLSVNNLKDFTFAVLEAVYSKGDQRSP